MPLPAGPFTVHGGCNCRAIRYTIAVPAVSERQLHPSIEHNTLRNNTSACRLPFTCFDHCNDCRNAVGALLPAWICTPALMVSVAALISESPSSSSSESEISNPNHIPVIPAGKYSESCEARSRCESEGFDEDMIINRPGLDLFAPPFAPEAPHTWLRYYTSSKGRTRTFCGRCGTNLCYNLRPMPEPWPEMLDIVLGTIDREDLEREREDGRGWFEPERQLWCGWGLPWLRKMVSMFDGPKHESYAPDVDIGEFQGISKRTI